LPKELVANLDLNTLEHIKGSFVDPALSEFFADLIFKCKSSTDGRERYITILLEHKSFYEQYLPFQLHPYITSSYQQQISNNEPPIPVIPIVLSHTKKTYQKKELKDFFSAYPSHVLEFVPNFNYILVDLAKIDSNSLENLGNAFLIAAMMGFKHSHDPERFVKQLNNIIRFLAKSHSRNLTRSFFVYFDQVVDLDDEKIINLYRSLPEPIKSEAMSTYDMLIEKGKEIGIKMGQTKGEENEKIKGATNLIKEGMPNEFIGCISVCRIRLLIYPGSRRPYSNARFYLKPSN